MTRGFVVVPVAEALVDAVPEGLIVLLDPLGDAVTVPDTVPPGPLVEVLTVPLDPLAEALTVPLDTLPELLTVSDVVPLGPPVDTVPLDSLADTVSLAEDDAVPLGSLTVEDTVPLGSLTEEDMVPLDSLTDESMVPLDSLPEMVPLETVDTIVVPVEGSVNAAELPDPREIEESCENDGLSADADVEPRELLWILPLLKPLVSCPVAVVVLVVAGDELSVDEAGRVVAKLFEIFVLESVDSDSMYDGDSSQLDGESSVVNVLAPEKSELRKEAKLESVEYVVVVKGKYVLETADTSPDVCAETSVDKDSGMGDMAEDERVLVASRAFEADAELSASRELLSVVEGWPATSVLKISEDSVLRVALSEDDRMNLSVDSSDDVDVGP